MICKTFKWMLLTGAVLGGAGFLFLGTAFPSYVSTMASSMRESVVGQIPIDLEIKRAENLIRQIDPQIETCKLDVVRGEIELERLHEEISRLEKVVDVQEKQLKQGAKLLSGDGSSEVVLAAADFGARHRVKASLQRTKDCYVNDVAILKTKRALVDRQTRAVVAANQRLNAVRTERGALEDQVRSLKTQQQQVEALAASSTRFDLDSTALSQAKEVIATVRNRLDVAQRMLENDMVYQGEDPLAVAVDERNVLKEIQELFAANGTSTQTEIELPVSKR